MWVKGMKTDDIKWYQTKTKCRVDNAGRTWVKQGRQWFSTAVCSCQPHLVRCRAARELVCGPQGCSGIPATAAKASACIQCNEDRGRGCLK